MTDKQLFRLADMAGVICATVCIAVSVTQISGGYLYLGLYAFGVFVMTNKLNRILRG